jgi:hypothetical protein
MGFGLFHRLGDGEPCGEYYAIYEAGFAPASLGLSVIVFDEGGLLVSCRAYIVTTCVVGVAVAILAGERGCQRSNILKTMVRRWV